MRLPIVLALTATLAAQEPRELFLANCAACHGERGDGKGSTPLPKPARSFLDGGFSYGNTEKAIERTIEYGIPGTPMPSFAEALSPEQRSSLVEYVIALGPPRKEVGIAETILVVGERPQVVRGYLPALTEGLPEWPRGLLLGLTSGTTFQYRADDLRLLAVRQGDFVQRRDWSGRGGNPLRPLGVVTHLVEGGNPRAPWSLGNSGLRAHLTGTRIRGEKVTVGYDLRTGTKTLAQVEESPGVIRSGAGSGFVQEYRITTTSPEALTLQLRLGSPADGKLTSSRLEKRAAGGRALNGWSFTYAEDGAFRLVAAYVEGREIAPSVHAGNLVLSLAPDSQTVLRVFHAVLVDEESSARLLEELH